MSDKNSRILHTFGDRLAVEQQLQALAQTRNARQQKKILQTLAQKDSHALKALLRHLDDNDPAMRGSLGLLAQHLPPQQIIPALRQTAMDTTRGDNARLTAVMLLERFLGEEIDAAMAQRIPASYDVARESGEEALSMAKTEPLVLVEYAEQLLDEPPEVVQAVLQVIFEMQDPHKVQLLMAIAAYGDETIQKEILQALGSFRHPLTLQALRTLKQLLPPSQQNRIRRQRQKLLMAGVQEAPGTTLRSLWSPTNAQGHSFLWFIHRNPDSNMGDLLSLILHDELGVVYAAAHPSIDLAELPPPAPRGHTHHVRMPDTLHQVQLAEIEPGLGLHLLDAALHAMQTQNFPWPGEIVVLGHWLWQPGAEEKTASWPRLPKASPPPDYETSQTLLEQPTFAGWAWTMSSLTHLLKNSSPKALSQNDETHQQVIALLMQEENRNLLHQRLLQQARWLTLTKNRQDAMKTLAIIEVLTSENDAPPFVQILAWRSLLTAAADRAMRNALTMLKQPSGSERPPHQQDSLQP